VSRAARPRFAAALAAVALAVAALARATPPATIERLDPRLDALLARDAGVEVYAGGIAWAEGPLWSAADGRLLFSDVPRNGIYSVHAGDPPVLVVERSGYEGPAPFAGREPGSNGLAFDAAGRLVYCRHGERDVARREPDGRVTVLAARHEGRRLNSPNDLVFRSDGALYFTDPPFGLPGTFDDPGKELPYQGVYRLRADGTLELLVGDLEAPNGLAFSPDERTLYVSNAFLARPVWTAYPVDEGGTLGPGRPFADARAYVGPGEGVPDGMKVDRRGNVWAAGPGGVHVFAPDGTRLGRIVTGVPTGNVAFGEDGGTLFIAANHRILRLRTLLAAPPAGAAADGR
jgi:gluconolactonase